ncbi:MAG: methionyl-tRNA formyltransferase [Candidatus Campbellbacteria bacterium]|nr:methionyl-tRNA formyltransferase [Candidatus Campbellbacteria bacterium]
MKPSFVFFGSPDIAVTALETLLHAGFIPHTIVTAPDAPQGRGLILTPPPVKVWAQKHAIPILQPEKLSEERVVSTLQSCTPEFFVVVAYGKIIPQVILNIPHRGTLNLHPSLLPRHRGPSPIESQILHEQSSTGVGVSIMLLDEKMDHGPILAQRSLEPGAPWPVATSILRPHLARIGAQLLCDVLPKYLDGTLLPIEQNHEQATYCKLIKKEDALLDMNSAPYIEYLKILAYDMWPRAFFFIEKSGKNIRVIVTRARFEDTMLTIEKVIPEGRKEMTYAEFLS